MLSGMNCPSRAFSFSGPAGHTRGVHDYDLLVIGSGPGGQKAAIAAAKLDRPGTDH